ncbi:MAG: DUF2339 domain-containing protein [Planctomycetes bacterium]|nr:DUF2339 domain-containing protein [Planctomycetota bacterium]
MTDPQRLAALEAGIARLQRELDALRDELRDARAASAPRSEAAPPNEPALADPAHAPSSAHEPRAAERARPEAVARAPVSSTASTASTPGTASSPSSPGSTPRVRATPRGVAALDLEQLVGRYGALALAVLTLMLGLGAFLAWAIRRGVFGPELRVISGALLAALIAFVGVRLRRRGTVRFGNLLLALALAVVHLDCWAAGPLLGLVPSSLALGIAALASLVLAGLALREQRLALFNVGFGAALLAPFVTSAGGGDPVVLLAYGLIVLAAGTLALRGPGWSHLPWVPMLGVGVYTIVAAASSYAETSWPRALAPTAFALAVSALAIGVLRAPGRSRLAHAALVAALGVLTTLEAQGVPVTARVTLAAAIALASFLAATPSERGARSAVLGAFLLPVAALIAALNALAPASNRASASLAVAWALGSVVAASFDRDGERRTHAFTATLLGALALLLLPHEREAFESCAALGLYAVLAAQVLGVTRLLGIAWATWVILVGSGVCAAWLLDRRTPFAYTPFATTESLAAAAVCAGWLALAWRLTRVAAERTRAVGLAALVVRVLAGLAVFLWIREELAHAFSRDVATFLLIAYYAITGVTAIGFGRRRASRVLRAVGLALSVLAAICAIVEASELTIAWRVAGYLLAGAFLLGIAYAYRADERATRRVTSEGSPDSAGPRP